MKFRIRAIKAAGFGEVHEGEDVLGGAVSGDNAYIACYSEPSRLYADKQGEIIQTGGRPNNAPLVLVTADGTRVSFLHLSGRHPHTLAVGGRCIRRYALSGTSAEYCITREE